MKAMILAAGLGERMRPLSLLLAKPVLPVLNRPLLHWTLERLARHGVTEVVINLHYLPETVVRAVGGADAFGLRVSYSREPRILGTGGGPRKARTFFDRDPFLLVNGDCFFDFDLSRLLARHRASGAAATLALKPNPDAALYGPVVTDRGGWIRSLPDLPRRPGPVSLFTGVHVIDPVLLDRLRPGPSDSVRDLYAPLIAAGGRVLGVRVRGAWYDLGRPKLYLDAQLRLLAARGFGRRPLVDRRARVGKGARVMASVVGAASVEAGARVERSVVWDGARVGRGAVVKRSILASGVEIAAGERVEGQVVVRAAGGRLPGLAQEDGRVFVELS
jgi:NDP-sugar pyrophosphorylase family protein